MNGISLNKCEIDIKKFQKIKRINKGGFGIVYKVEEKVTGRFFAAKVIDCNDDETKCDEIINREVGIMRYINHPTIIKFIGYSKFDFQEEHNIVILMELANNGSLRDALRKIQENDGPKDYTNTTRQIILVGICNGMKYLHDRNIIHRDLKAENILLDDDFHPHISDFGLSKFFEIGHSYSQSQFVGTLSYEAPEIIKKIPYDKKVDVYSFAILMFEIITDSIPYPELEKNEMTDYDFKNKVVNKRFRPKFNVPVKKSLRNLIEKCWSDDPDDRPTFDYIFNKLSNQNKEDNDCNDNEDYLLDDIDMDEFNLYVDDILEPTDNTDKLLNKIKNIEKENQQIKNELKKLIIENKQQKDMIESIENNQDQLRIENVRLEKENKQLKAEIKQIKDELEERKIKLKKTKIETDNNKKEIIQVNNHFNLNEINQKSIQVLVIGGRNNYIQFDKNHKSQSDINIPQKLAFDISTLRSFSIYFEHSVLVTNDGLLYGAGQNYDGRISSSFQKTCNTSFTKFAIKDSKNHHLTPISAVCSDCGTLYMLENRNSSRKLAYCDWQINGGNPVFLDIGNEEPAALYGGCVNAAAITSKGKIIFINRHSIKKSPKSQIVAVSLPEGKKAINIACGINSVIALSSDGKVFESSVTERSSILRFWQVRELSGQVISCISGTKDHFLAVNKEGCVFARGSNEYGQLGLGKGVNSISTFTEISLLRGYEIRASYAGYHHSLFETTEGKILSCGPSYFGQLLISNGPKGNVYLPTETIITKGATFCIAGYLSIVFIGCEPPPYIPNKRIHYK